MQRLTADACEWLPIRTDRQRIIVDNKIVGMITTILKDSFILSVVVMTGAALTLILGR